MVAEWLSDDDGLVSLAIVEEADEIIYGEGGEIVRKRSMQFSNFPTLMQDLSRRCIAMRGGEWVLVPS